MAQSNNTTATDQVRIVIHEVMGLDLKNNLGGEARFEFTDRQQVEQGMELIGASSIGIRSNKDWNLSVRAESDYFLTEEGGSELPVEVLQVRVNGNQNYLPISGSSQVLNSGRRGDNSRPGNQFDIDYRADLMERYYAPGNFRVSLVYTVSQQ
ncbi:hypothetical protein KIH41_09380 [Litoribacter ruber]|uniref:hypothetical protein n=1 Tax=Litoribacter ruber TaxID=702568 RepID=UPI001BDB44EC|nr:hypothetical protein [Litoribacter ruber]MBT0811488.1 hypothetical protein [Litoribacter ruber]